MIKKLLTVLALIMFVNAVRVPDRSGIEKSVEEFKSKTKCESVSVVVCDHGETYYYGDKDALYQIGSMTKAFTGLAIEQLITDDLLSEEDTVDTFIPGFKVYYNSSVANITVRDLLMQRSGFTNSETDYPSAKDDMTLGKWAESISGKELKSCPGTEYSYSNVNYNLLGLIIENVSGMSYREYMEEHVLQELGLESTTAGMPANKEKIMRGTRLGFRTTFEYEIPVREGSIPAGYFYSNAKDIGIWMNAWINGQEPEMDEIMSNLQNKGDYYAGWERFDGDTIGHSGGTPNYSSRLVFSASRGIGVCVLTNVNVAASTDSLCNNIFCELTGNAHEGLVCDVWTVFDIIFTSVTATGALILVFVFFQKKKGALIGTGSVLLMLLVLILILLPVIFGAGIKDIALVWAPWSFLTGMVIMAIDIACIAVKYIMVKVNEGREKTG